MNSDRPHIPVQTGDRGIEVYARHRLNQAPTLRIQIREVIDRHTTSVPDAQAYGDGFSALT